MPIIICVFICIIIILLLINNDDDNSNNDNKVDKTHRWNRNPRPQPKTFSKLLVLM